MPIPEPQAGESKDDFVSRCMGDIGGEYDDNDQALAICYDAWDKKRSKKVSFETREKRPYTLNLSVETRGDEKPRIRGHAAIFNEWANVGWFEERIMPGAFKNSIGADDVRALFNHDPNFILGRTGAGTLTLKEDERGLAIEIDPPDTQFARDLMVSIRRGDISQMSFGFQTIEDRWTYGKDGEPDRRELLSAKLFDISPVVFPAYENTDVAVRSWNKQKCKPKHSDTLRKKLRMKERRFKDDTSGITTDEK